MYLSSGAACGGLQDLKIEDSVELTMALFSISLYDKVWQPAAVLYRSIGPVLVISFTLVLLGDGIEKFAREEGDSCVRDNITGTCQKYTRCATAALIDKQYKQFPEICSFQGKEPVVCCTDCYIYDDVRDIVLTDDGVYTHTRGKNKAWDNCLLFVKTLPYVCKAYHVFSSSKKFHEEKQCHYIGIQHNPGLIGQPAKRGDFPYMALLGYGEDQESAQWLCGGSIISEWFILTAGHCRSSPDVGSVRFAALGILKRSDPPSLWQTYRISQFIPHPEYTPPSKYNDIALIKTLTQIKFDATVLPVCLATEPVDAPVGVVVGWGAKGHRAPVADVLHTAKLVKFNDSECSALYPKHRLLENGYDNRTQACYGHKETNYDTCEGDSGGPLLAASNLYGLSCVKHQIGVTSYGRPCGVVHSAGVYTVVWPYIDWITSVVWP